MSHTLMREEVARELAGLETDAHLAVQAKGWRFLGPEKITSLFPFDRATSWEPLRSRNPIFAVGRGQREAFFEAVIVLRASEHQTAARPGPVPPCRIPLLTHFRACDP